MLFVDMRKVKIFLPLFEEYKNLLLFLWSECEMPQDQEIEFLLIEANTSSTKHSIIVQGPSVQ